MFLYIYFSTDLVEMRESQTKNEHKAMSVLTQ